MTPLLGSSTIVMATAAVSVVLSLTGRVVLSRILFVLAVLAWAAFVVLVGRRLVRDRVAVREEARSPAALAAVAATATLGARVELGGGRDLAIVLLVLAIGGWSAIFALARPAAQIPSNGSSFLLTVSLELVAILAALLAHAVWLTAVALVLAAAGLGWYPIVLRKFDIGELTRGKGDQWVAGGALAITSLAAAEVSIAADRGSLRGLVPALHAVAIAIWAMSIAWWLVLVISEITAPRLHYDKRRWSTVFPIAVYAASSLAVARIGVPHQIASIARAWTWVGFAVWMIVGVGAIREAARSRARSNA